MKNSISIKLALTLACAILTGLMPQGANAEIEADANAGQKAMMKGEWAKAIGLYGGIIAEYSNGRAQFGGLFGSIYYKKGYSELQLAKRLLSSSNEKDRKMLQKLLTDAKASFQGCIDTPNIKRQHGPNNFLNKSLLYLGQAHQYSTEYPIAIKKYKAFTAGRKKQKKKDSFDRGMFKINMAICHFKLEKPDLPKGLESYEYALTHKKHLYIPDSAIVNAFKDFAAAAIKLKKEKLLVDFINKNRGVLTLDPYKMYQFIPFFRKYASDAFAVNMMDASFNLYALLPGTKETFEDISVYSKNLLDYKGNKLVDIRFKKNTENVFRIRSNYEHIKKSMSKGEPHELLALRSLAATHEGEGYVRGAYNAYKTLELHYKKTKGREDNLFNLVRTSSLASEMLETEKYGNLFLRKFPESKYVGAVKNMMLISLFYSGEYKVALKVATQLIGDLAEKTKQHDLCLHVLGGSMFYLGKYFDADPHLKKHASMYPESTYKVSARYFVASNYSRLEDWTNAAMYLDKFLVDFPDTNTNPFIPLALFDRANTHFADEQLKEAVVKLNKIEDDFPSSTVESISFNLRGDVHRALKEKAKANKYYLKALALGKRQGSSAVVEEALYKLVALHGVQKVNKEPNPNIKDAIPYYDEFWKEHQKSPYKAQVTTAGVYALRAAGRGGEALENIQGVISEMAKKKDAPGLEQAINTYGKLYLESGKTPEQLKMHFENFPGIDAGDRRAQALLSVAVIGVYEEINQGLRKSKDPKDIDKRGRIAAKIEAMFKDMDRKFKKSELSDFILMRLANFISDNTGNSRMALPYYEEVLGRPSVKFRIKAQFGKARILSSSKDPSEQNKALTTLRMIVTNNKNLPKEDKEKAMYNIIEVFDKQEKWNELIKYCVDYNKSKFQSRNKARVGFILAKSYEKSGDIKNARKIYGAVYSRYKANWEVSIPALLKSAQYTRTDGKSVKGKSPKQIAYDMVARFSYGSTNAYEKSKLKMLPEVRKSWEDLRTQVKRWESESGIKSYAKQRQEKEANQ